MQIKLLKPGDEALMRRAEDLFYPGALTTERATRLLREPTFVMVVALSDDGEPISRYYGHILYRFEATDFLIYEVDTAQNHQRQGAARAILDFLKHIAHEHGWREMWVLTDPANEAGNRLYRSGGGHLENSPANMYVFHTTSS